MTEPKLGEGGLIVVEKDNGEAGRGLPRDEGLELGGDSRNRVGSLGDGTRGKGELGLEGVRELFAMVVSTGTGLEFLFAPWSEEEEDLGD